MLYCTQELDSKLMHPAAQKYFFLREIKLKNPPFGNVNGYKNEYNAKVCHPVYFSSHYERQPSRHSKIALSLAKIVTYERAVGEQYRYAYMCGLCEIILSVDGMACICSSLRSMYFGHDLYLSFFVLFCAQHALTGLSGG